MGKKWNIALVGATSEVGGQMIECLEERKFPVGNIRYMSESGIGELMEFKGKPVVVEKPAHDSFAGIDIALFAAGSTLAKELCPSAAGAGAICIDSSSAWRMDPAVPLVVPDVNPHAITLYSGKGIIASPGCSSIQIAMTLKPLHDYGRIRRVVVSTYHAVSSDGKNAIEELHRQTIAVMSGKPVKCRALPHRIAFNCLPNTGPIGDNGYTREEMQIADEAGKIMETDVRITATTVLVPVFYGLCQALNIETGKKISTAKAREILANAPGLKLVDDVAKNVFPMPSDAAGQDMVFVGRIREDESIKTGLNLWLVADNIRNEASNAVRIAELLIEKHLKS